MAFPCGVCSLETSGTKCLLCRSCGLWFHSECEKVSKATFNILDKNRNLNYTCVKCVDDPTDNSDSAFKVEVRNEFAGLRDTLRSLAQDLKSDQAIFKNDIELALGEIRADLSNGLKQVQDDVLLCKNLVTSHKVENQRKFYELELQNHILQHRLNRSDIVITGLPDNLNDTNEIVKSLCAHLNVDIAPGDILIAMYIRSRHAILVKFLQIEKRDKLMSAYFKSKSLTVGDVLSNADNNRVFLNDNYSSLANRLLKFCSNLKKDKKIISYSIINREILKTKLLLPNNVVKLVSFQECMDNFESNLNL